MASENKNDGPRLTNGLAEQVRRWRKLADRCGVELADLPHLAANHAALEEAVGRIQQSFHEQAVLQAQLSALIQRRRHDAATAREFRNRLAAGLSAHYGPGSDELRRFGLKPRRRKVRRRVAEAGVPN